MDTTVQVDEQGAITLPSELCDKYGLRTGDTLWLVDLEGMLVLTRTEPIVPKLVREVERLREEAGLSLDELLQSLQEQREQTTRNDHGEIA